MSRPIRVLHIIGGGEIGGAEIHILDLARHLSPGKIEVHLCCLFPAPLLQWAQQQGVSAVAVPMRSKFDIFSLWKVAQVIKKVDPQIVHTHGVRANMIGRLAAALVGSRKIITTVHSVLEHDYPDQVARKLNYWLECATSGLTDRYIAISEFIKTSLVEQGIPREKVTVIHNGVELEKFTTALVEPLDEKSYCPSNCIDKKKDDQDVGSNGKEDANAVSLAYCVNSFSIDQLPNPVQRDQIAQQLRKHYGLNECTPLVGMVGRFHPVKGHAVLVKAAKEIVKLHRDVRFLLVGDGFHRPEIEEMVIAEGLSPYFIFAGFRDDVSPVYRAIDILALPSLSEGLCLTVMESMLSGCPVVASRVGGIPEVITDGKDGVLITAGDPLALAAGIVNLLEDREKMKRLSQTALKTIHERFTVKKMAERTEALYEHMMDEDKQIVEKSKNALKDKVKKSKWI
ncbi:glycosyltransferase [Heliorestis acidaminivorans]|uniref:Glycosyltransferase n=1 Tax=Heliorestis acidaminivorans TaxID=553427 RepID=A0A6I0F2K6_9FIRM|nr:glycosyltransferase [Heliorestis acidaminivorans]KAB2953653.1 glycosyltransferase [Heliorestis acidaminivorans]